MAFLRLLRVHQWVKNGLVFVPLFFSSQTIDDLVSRLPSVAWVFLAFSIIASASYVVNDLNDIKQDRHHPIKSKRPLPSGQITENTAKVIALIAFVTGLSIGVFSNVWVVCILLIYFVNNLLYSYWLKHQQLIDVFSISIGFILRVFAGAAAIGVPVSPFLFLAVLFGTLFLGFGKRRHEILLMGDESSKHRTVLKHYSVYYLDQLMVISGTMTLSVYILYALEIAPPWFSISVPIVTFGLFRYYFLTHYEKGGEPSDELLRDRPLLAVYFLYSLVLVFKFMQGYLPI